jgi:adenine-specific DNA modification methylase
MNASKKLVSARVAKCDEFYTQLKDIEDELVHYKHHLRGKVVYCNCDNPYKSNFVRYFIDNFKKVGIKKLIATHFIEQTYDGLFDDGNSHRPHVLEYDEIAISTIGREGYSEEVVHSFSREMEGDGDFRSEECLSFLQEADIVITNPPFSLIREFIKTIVDNGKDFIVIGNITTLSTKDIFPLFQSNQLYIGVTHRVGHMKFEVPSSYELNSDLCCSVGENNASFITVTGCRWLASIRPPFEVPFIKLVKSYSEEEYPKLDNYDAIEVSTTASIPHDYDGVMAVPLTFLDKYNEAQFEIVGMNCVKDGEVFSSTRGRLNGRILFVRVMIRRRNKNRIFVEC